VSDQDHRDSRDSSDGRNNRPKRHGCNFFLLSLLSLLSLFPGCGGESVRESVTPPSKLSIIYSCDTRGHIEPCGCSSGQAGGISRRMTFLKEQVPGPRLLVDAGDVTAGPRNWEIFEMEYILKGYAAMGYHAVNVGHREISLGAEKLKEVGGESGLFISANVMDASGALLFPPYKVVTVEGGYRVGILGVTDENVAPEDQGEGITITPAADAVGKYLPEITPQADFIVVLAFLEEDAMKRLAEHYFEIGVIVGGRVLQPTHTPVEVNQSRLVYITDKGKAVGKLDIAFGADGQATYANSIHMLADTMMEAPEITPIVDEFKVRLAEMDFQPHRDDDEGLTTITAARSGTANKYVSEAACVACHPKTVEAWKGFKHAHALESLVARGHDSNPRCLQCHTVGYGATDGYVNQRLTPALASVSCENCHGRGDHHVKFHNKEDVPERSAKMATIACETCHDPENSPAFNYETYWEKIKHGKD